MSSQSAPLRLALVGVGAWGQRYAQTIARRTDCVLAGYARSRAEGPDVDWPGLGSPPRFADAEAIFAAASGPSPSLDGVIVATEPRSQAFLALEAAESGVPLLVEKPLGLTADDAERVVAARGRASRRSVLLVNFIHLWSPAYLTLKAEVREACRQSARVAAIETEGSQRGPFRSFSTLADYAPHDLALCFDLVGLEVPWTLDAVSSFPGPPGQPPERTGLLVEAQLNLGGVAVRLRCGNGGESKIRRFVVKLDDGRSWTYDDTLPLATKLMANGRPVPLSAALPLEEVLRDFLCGIRAVCGPRPVANDNLALAVRVGQAVDAMSARL